MNPGDPGDALTFALAAAAFIEIGVLWFAAGSFLRSPNRKVKRRIDALDRLHPERRVGTAAESIQRDLADSSIAGIDRLLKRLLPNARMLRQRLERTGRPIRLGTYILVSAALVLAGIVVAGAVLPMAMAVRVLVGVAAGLGLPWMIVGRMGRKRVAKFTALFPDAIDLMVRGLRSGLPITETVKSAGEEIADPVGVEFRRIAESVRLGRSFQDALWDAALRLDTPEFRFFVISLSVQRETGGNLAETLGHLADLLRRRRQMLLKVKAMSSEARASAMILGSLPFVMFAIIFAMNPDYANKLFVDPRGVMMLSVGVGMMFLGILVMAKMIRFEI